MIQNFIAIDSNGNIVNSIDIYNLRKAENRKNAREEKYFCPHCKTEMVYAHGGGEGYFKHIPSTLQDIKDSCPYYHSLLSGADKETAIQIEKKRKEIQNFLDANQITGYKPISYFNETKLTNYVEKHPDENFIMITKMITEKEKQNFIEYGKLRLRKKALAKYIISNKKPVLEAFVGINGIFHMEYNRDFNKDVLLSPHLYELKSNTAIRGMKPDDITKTKLTLGFHDNRQSLTIPPERGSMGSTNVRVTRQQLLTELSA